MKIARMYPLLWSYCFPTKVQSGTEDDEPSDNMTDDEEEEEELLVRQLTHHLVQASPAKHPVLLRDDSPEPPIRDAVAATEKERDGKAIEAEEDEVALLARALQEEELTSDGRKSSVGSPQGVGANMLVLEHVTTIARRLDTEFEDTTTVGSPLSTTVGGLPQLHKSVEDIREEQILINFLEQASSEFVLSKEVAGKTSNKIDTKEKATLAKPKEDRGDEKKSDRLERAKLKILVKELKAELTRERTRADAAEARAADLYAQRFALAMICAASVPPLGVALLAHRYDLHDWEARSDALGVLLVAIVGLFFLAVSLWRRARAQLDSPSAAPMMNAPMQFKPGQEEVVPKLPVSASVRSDDPSAAGLRKRQSKKGALTIPATKSEAVL